LFISLPKMFCVKKLCPHGKMPCRGSMGAAGYDLYAATEVVVKAFGRGLVGTGIALSLPVGVYGRVASRSGLSLKHGLEVGGGVIDRDYTGEVKVIVYNHGDCDYTVRVGDRVAQLVLERCAHFVVTEVDELCVASERADSGFGSTGV
jgi:dUTP pyrophosphatase